MDVLKTKSLVLLMAYDLPGLLKNELILKESEQDINPLFDEFLLLIRNIKEYPIDIYAWTPDWENICSLISLSMRLFTRLSFLDSNSILLLLEKYQIEAGSIDLKTLSKRITYITQKYYLLKLLFDSIYNNYREFKKFHLDLEYGSEKFNEAILRKINKGKRSISAKRIHKDIRDYFNNSKRDKTKIFKFIMNNLPLDVLTEIDTNNKNKIALVFRKKMAIELMFYFDKVKLSITQKQYLLGFSFQLCRLIDTQEEFILKRMVKDRFYQFDYSDIDEYLRTQGYNVYKTL